MEVVVCVKDGTVTAVYATEDADITIIDHDLADKDEAEILKKAVERITKSRKYKRLYKA